MCVRYVIASRSWWIEKELRVEFDYPFQPVYNAYPGGYWPVISSDNEGVISLAKWGLTPHWAKRPVNNINYNAAAYDIIKHRVFRIPVRKRRCLVLANCFYHWVREDKSKVPHVVYLRDQRLMTFAGVWDEWRDKAASTMIKSYSIVTCPSNKRLRKYMKTMPVIIPPEFRRHYLDQRLPLNEVMKMLDTYESDQFNLYPVSDMVNGQLIDNRELVMPVGERKYAEFIYNRKIHVRLEGMGSSRGRLE